MNILSKNPFGDFRKECELTLREALKRILPKNVILSPAFKEKISSPPLEVPSSPNFGDLASSLCLEMAIRLNVEPKRLAEKITDSVNLSKTFLIKSVRPVRGYINFYADNFQLSKLTLESARFLSKSYGYIKVASPLKIIIEHTSVNPAGPVHVGTARNSILGDSLTRLLKARGHDVTTHFYVDDVGRQIAVLAYGYSLLNKLKPKGKADHWVGLVYAITSCILEIGRLKRKLKELEVHEALSEQLNRVRLDLDDWISAAANLQERAGELFESLLDHIMEDTHPEESIAKIMRLYERNNPETKRRIREVVALCLEGFKETYGKAEIFWDSWDWESDLVWSGAVSDALNKLRKSPYCAAKEGAFELNVDIAADNLQLKKRFGIPEEHEIPPLILARSDGTSLYPTRDIAYSLWKLSRADKVINVIGVEQSLAQLQIRIALSILVSIEKAENLIHYAYELVKIPGYKMSKRRGRYITFDELIDEAVKRALTEVNTRSPDLPYELKKKISKDVGVGAVKYTLLDVAPSKQVDFTWDKILNFEMNSAPFIQYAYARACNILEKVEAGAINPDYTLLKESIEMELVRKMALFPEIFVSAADGLTPSLITEFAYSLSAKFNSFYASLMVLKAEPMGLRDARLAIVESVKITLENTLNLLGIKELERM